MEGEKKKEQIMTEKTKDIGLIIICSAIVLISIIVGLNKPYTFNERGTNDTSGTGSGSYNNSSNELNTVYLNISDIEVTSNSSYTICTGTISVSSYSPYKYHYIKVKGAFKTISGTTVDTDWTYAIGSEWLEPGESTKFRLSVSKDSRITDCSVTIMKD